MKLLIVNNCNFNLELPESTANELDIVGEFSDPEDAYSFAHEHSFSCALLTISVSNFRSLALGQKLRELNPDLVLIYCSNTDSLIKPAILDAKADYFLLTSAPDDEFIRILRRAVRLSIPIPPDPLVTVKKSSGVEVIPLSRLSYIECGNHRVLYHKIDGSIVSSVSMRVSFEQIASNLLAYPDLLRIHKSYVVNQRHIVRMTQKMIYLNDGTVLTISLRRQKIVHDAFQDWLAQNIEPNAGSTNQNLADLDMRR